MKISILIAVVLLASAPRIAKVDPALLEHWKYDSQVPLNFQQGGLQHRGSVKIYDVTFASPVGDRGKAVGPKRGNGQRLPCSPSRDRAISGGDLWTLVHAGFGKEESGRVLGRSRGIGAVGFSFTAARPCVSAAGFRRGRYPFKRKPGRRDGATSCEPITV